LGEAYSAFAEDASAIYWNPAGIGRVERKSLALMHAAHLQNIFYDYGAYAQPIPNIGTFGVSLQYISSPRLDQLNAAGETVGTFRLYDFVLTLGYGKLLKDKGFGGMGDLALGFSSKFIQSRILETANTGAVDFGLIWLLSEKMRFAFAIQNLGGKLKFVNRSYHIPFNFKLGSYYKITNSWLAAADINFPRDNDPNAGFGTEYKKKVVREISLSARAGFNSRTVADIYGLNSLAAGIGLSWRNYGFDFAWIPFGGLGKTYRFSFNAEF